MACFIVPATEAVVTTVATKIIEKREEKAVEQGLTVSESGRERLSGKLKRLNYMLWGGSGLLAFEHLWHGEIKPFFPFFTAAESKTELLGMFSEMSTIGVSMAVIVTVTWGIMTIVTNKIVNRKDEIMDESKIRR